MMNTRTFVFGLGLIFGLVSRAAEQGPTSPADAAKYLHYMLESTATRLNQASKWSDYGQILNVGKEQETLNSAFKSFEKQHLPQLKFSVEGTTLTVEHSACGPQKLDFADVLKGSVKINDHVVASVEQNFHLIQAKTIDLIQCEKKSAVSFFLPNAYAADDNDSLKLMVAALTSDVGQSSKARIDCAADSRGATKDPNIAKDIDTRAVAHFTFQYIAELCTNQYVSSDDKKELIVNDTPDSCNGLNFAVVNSYISMKGQRKTQDLQFSSKDGQNYNGTYHITVMKKQSAENTGVAGGLPQIDCQCAIQWKADGAIDTAKQSCSLNPSSNGYSQRYKDGMLDSCESTLNLDMRQAPYIRELCQNPGQLKGFRLMKAAIVSKMRSHLPLDGSGVPSPTGAF